MYDQDYEPTETVVLLILFLVYDKLNLISANNVELSAY